MTLKPLFSNAFHSLCLLRSACFLWNFLLATLSRSDTFSLKWKPVFLFRCLCMKKITIQGLQETFLTFSPMSQINIHLGSCKTQRTSLIQTAVQLLSSTWKRKIHTHKRILGNMYKNAILFPSFSQQPSLLAVLWSTMYTDNWITAKSMKTKKSYGTSFANESTNWFGRKVWHSKVSTCADELRLMGRELF